MVNTYKRGQVELGLWQHLCRDQNMPADPPKIFRTRINRLIEIDRKPSSDLPRQAFCNLGAVGTGNELRFTVFDAFALGVGLELLNAGFKQQEVVFALSHIRPDLDAQFQKIDMGPGLDRNRLSAADYPDLPTYRRDGVTYADPRVFAVFERVEMTEMFDHQRTKEPSDPAILVPVYCDGMADLTDALREMGIAFGHATLVELAGLATAMKHILPTTPELKRGRQ